MDFGTCRSCKQSVYWTRTAAHLKPMPLEEAPETGNVLVDDVGLAHVFADHETAVAAMDDDRFPLGCTYRSHFVSCPDAAQHRSAKSRRRPTPKRVEHDEEPLF